MVDILRNKTESDHFQDLKENAKEHTAHHAHSYLFMCYCLLDQPEEALQVLENLFDHKSSILMLSFSDPICSGLMDSTQYKEYHDRIYPSEELVAPKQKKELQIQDFNVQQDVEKLNQYMVDEKPYLNPGLSLRSLAHHIQVHPNHLSWLLNKVLGQNFNEFINEKRIEHFKKLSIDPSNSHISLIGLAYESGFNSKTVFNTAFKKSTGMTPKAYQKANFNS